MKLSLTLLETDSAIRQMILRSLAEDVSRTISRAIPEIRIGLRTLLESALKAEPEYSSLISGKLRAELGIVDTNIVDNIIDKMCNTLIVTSKPINISNIGLSGGLSVTAISSSDIGGLISDSDAFVNDPQRGYSLPWLEWLTLKGTSPIIKEYKVDMTSSPYSRTGMALMVSDSGSSWSVPPEFAGVEENNWTTRAVERIESQIVETIKQSIEKHI